MKRLSHGTVVVGILLGGLACQSSSDMSGSGMRDAGGSPPPSGSGGSPPLTLSGSGGVAVNPPVLLGSGGGSSSAGGAAGGRSLASGGAYGMGGANGMGGISSRGGATSVPAQDAGAAPSPDAGPMASDAGDKYTPVGTNPFVMTAHDPFSTFGADVDTASYDIFRRDAKLGQLPTASSVRLEEYVNYFSYAYPAPLEGSPYPFQISLAAANQVFDRGTALLRVGIQAMQPPPFVKRPTNLVFLLDVSGSMGDAKKLPLVKSLILATIERLDASDTVSLVTYSDEAQVVLGPTSMEKKAQLSAAVAALSAGGSTAGADGLGLAYQEASLGFIAGGINHIVLCTDGDFNVGPSSTSELLSIIRSKRSTGVTLTVLGFGSGNLNDAMMEQVADAGNGIYSVIIDEASAQRYAAEKILATVTHVAKDMKIQVEFNPERVAAYRLLGYEDRGIADTSFRNDAVDGGEVGAGHRVTALYELVLAGHGLPTAAGAPVADDGPASTLPREVSAADFVLVKVRYKPVDATDATPAIELAGSLPSVLLAESLDAADADLQWATAVAALAELLKRSPYADRSFIPTIQSIVAAQSARDADRAELATLLSNIVGKL